MTTQHFKIAVSGDLGSGKSTVCRLLLENLPGFRAFSMGEAWRRLAGERGMTILELNQYSETHPLDEEMDRMLAEMGKEPQNIIFDSRLAWHFVPHAFKLHLLVNPQIAAERIMGDRGRGDAEEYTDLADALQKIMERRQSEYQRYLQKYGLDCSDLSHYDLLIDTSGKTPGEVVALILAEFEGWQKRELSAPDRG
jgi:cytidylate kinase